MSINILLVKVKTIINLRITIITVDYEEEHKRTKINNCFFWFYFFVFLIDITIIMSVNYYIAKNRKFLQKIDIIKNIILNNINFHC